MNDDFLDLLSALLDAKARFLIVGAYAVGVHARPRATKDLDVWVEASPENSRRVIRALKAFGAPVDNLNDDDFARPGTGFMMGAPPNRIDILTEISGVTFEEAWPNQVAAGVGRNLHDHPDFVFGYASDRLELAGLSLRGGWSFLQQARRYRRERRGLVPVEVRAVPLHAHRLEAVRRVLGAMGHRPSFRCHCSHVQW